MCARVLCAACLLAAVLLSGCAATHSGGGFGTRCPKDLESQLKLIDMKRVFGDMAHDLCGGGESFGTVLVTDFVDLESLKSDSSGILMGEVMRSSLSSACGYDIQQAELARYFTLGPNGLVALTRRGEAIKKDDLRNADFVVGTFNQSNEKLVLFAKKFNTRNNLVTMISSREITFTCSDWGAEYTVH